MSIIIVKKTVNNGDKQPKNQTPSRNIVKDSALNSEWKPCL